MTNPMQVSLQEEFNRLNFLASIATGGNGENSMKNSLETTQLTSPHSSIVNGIPENTELSLASNINGNSSKNVITTGSLGKINSLLINAGHNSSSISTPFQFKDSNTFSSLSLNQNSSFALGRIKTESQFQTHLPSPKFQSPRLQNSNEQHAISQQKAALTLIAPQVQPVAPKRAMLNLQDGLKLGLKTPAKASSITDEKKRLLSNVNILQNCHGSKDSLKQPLTVTQSHTVHLPLAVSQTQQSSVASTSKSILAQPSISATSGQTILLPANVAGIQGVAGKVFIVSTPGKTPTAVTLTSTSRNMSLQQLQQQVLSQVQNTASDGSRRQMFLLPNTTSQSAKVPKSKSLTTTSTLSKHIKHLLVDNSNNTSQSLKIQQSSSQPLQRIQSQPISMSNFQTIRPKTGQSSLPGPTIRPNLDNMLQATTVRNQAVRLSHFSSFSTANNPKLGGTLNNTTVSLSAPITTNSKLITQVSTTSTTSSLMSQFDKTMSQHLQTLEKTDPHLFFQSGSKLVINQTKLSSSTLGSSSPDSKTYTITTAGGGQHKINENVKNDLHQQQQQQIITTNQSQQQIITTNQSQQQIITANQSQQQFSNSKLVANPQSGFLKQQVALATQQLPENSATMTIPQHILNMPQMQQVNLQSILQQQIIQQQKQQILQKRALSEKNQAIQQSPKNVATHNLHHQLQQQQQQLHIRHKLKQNATHENAVNQSQMYLEQKILQQVQNQQKLNPQLIRFSLNNQQQQTFVLQQEQQNSPQQHNQQLQIQQLQQRLSQPSSLPNQPLKLLSNLTSLVQQGGTALSVSSSSGTLQATNIQGLNSRQTQHQFRPVLVQLANGTHMLQTAQLTHAQILELQKRINAGTILPPGKSVHSVMPQVQQQAQSQMPNNITSVGHQKAKNVNSSPSTSAAIHSLRNRSATSQSVFASQEKEKSRQKIVHRTGLASGLKDSTAGHKLQEQLRQLPLAQKELLLKQYAQGKLSSKTVLNPMLASILKQSQQAEGSSESAVKETSKAPVRVAKRPADTAKNETPEHPLAKRWRSTLQQDQMRYVSCSYKLPFSSKQDAIKRLLPYHITQDDHNPNDFVTYNSLFDAYAVNFQRRREWLLQKFNLLLLNESQITRPSCDDVLTGRLFVATETERFRLQKQAVLEGRAFVVKNETTGGVECVELSETKETKTAEEITKDSQTASRQLKHQLDDRLVVAHKDISTIDCQSDTDAEDEEIDDDVDDEEDVGEEIEVEQLSEIIYLDPEDNEMADAATNLLADLEDDEEYNLDFDL